jgi:hypothetical protein
VPETIEFKSDPQIVVGPDGRLQELVVMGIAEVTRGPLGRFIAASAGSKAITTTLPVWSSWAGTNGEVVSHMSVWDSTTAGSFLYSFALTASKTMNTGDTLTLSSHSISLTPLAA